MINTNPKTSEDVDSQLRNMELVDAAIAGNVPLVSRLLQLGANVNTTEPANGMTCLHIACVQGNKDLATFLVNYHQSTGEIEFNLRTKVRPRLAWQLALNGHHFEIAELVLSASSGQAPTPAI